MLQEAVEHKQGSSEDVICSDKQRVPMYCQFDHASLLSYDRAYGKHRVRNEVGVLHDLMLSDMTPAAHDDAIPTVPQHFHSRAGMHAELELHLEEAPAFSFNPCAVHQIHKVLPRYVKDGPESDRNVSPAAPMNYEVKLCLQPDVTSRHSPSNHVQASVPAAQTLRRRGHRSGTGVNRLWCHFYLDPSMLEPGFDLVKKIIGRGGCNTRGIFDATQTKVRVRGKGSGHKEQHNGREAPVPLMIALAAPQSPQL
jgi:hypothetical protein